MNAGEKLLGKIKRLLDVSPLDVLRQLRSLSRRSGPGSGGLSTEQRLALETMRGDLAGAGAPFTPSAHWQDVVRLFEAVFRRQGIRNPEEQYFNLRFSGFSPGDCRLHRYVCWMYRALLQPRDCLSLLQRLRATCREGDGFGYRFQDEYLSLDLLLSIDDFYNLYELNPAIATEPVIVAELGAGWGRLGYVLRSVNPRSRYVVLDLPEVLLISQTYLPRLLPGDSVCSYVQARAAGSLSRQVLGQHDLWFLGPHDIARIEAGGVDLVVNIASFQEMPVAYVAAYCRHFSRIAAGGHCFVRQLYDGRAHGHAQDEIAGLEAYPFPQDWQRAFLRHARLSADLFEAGFQIPRCPPAAAPSRVP